ncbi:immunoglobulin kappa light chain-like [Trichomycterus rosablanca]|uniref:immunoglobulin kappa light chain-like n=1 Tax=Trichomycterus rosablanca TaxID=2290929 RepID=UPI002F35E17D
MGKGKAYSGNKIQQEQLKVALVGETITLSCIYSQERKTTIAWIKQKPGEKPIAIAHLYQTRTITFLNGFDKSGRFSITKADTSFNLTISNLDGLDSATYYCAVTFLSDITYGEGTLLIVKGTSLKKHSVVQQPVVEMEDSEDSVTLQCIVLTKNCPGQYVVSWFTHGLRESHPEMIYTDGDSSDQCKNRSDAGSSTQRCIYSLPKRNLRTSDAGTYYCTVATCGEILCGSSSRSNCVRNVFFYVVVLFNHTGALAKCKET